MADQPIGNDEIERLLKEAQAELSQSPLPTPPVDPLSQALTEQDLAALAGASAPPAAPAKPATKPSTPARDDGIASDDVELLLQQAQEAIASIDLPREPQAAAKAFQLDEFGGATPSTERATLELIRDVELDLRIEFGRTQMYLEDVLKLRKGSVVPLDKLAGDPVDIFVNGRLIAKGEVLVLNDNFCVRVAELIAGEQPV
ncbi:MAG TPA: flagellar motor switch protein FliN [Pirellulales bacterium]|nr:flagellar motor switch protein FliN [Pirellulales bacterium]